MQFLVDSEDAERVLAAGPWSVRRGGRTWYATRNVRGAGKRRTESLHRFLMGDIPSGLMVDHVNGNGLDNRRANLRVATRSENGRNRQRHSNNSSGVPGVHLNKRLGRWQAYVRLDGKLTHLGVFESLDAAVAARADAAKRMHGEFARAV